MRFRFLVLIDLSEGAAELLRFAKCWAERLGAELVIVHKVAAAVPALTHPQSKQEIIKAEIGQALIHLKQLVAEAIDDYPVKYRISDSNLVVALPDILEEGYNDIVFAGLKSTGLLKKLFIGSTIADVIDYVHNIVIAVPAEVSLSIPDKISVAITPEYPLNIKEFEKVLQIFGGQIKSIYFFSVSRGDADRQATEVHLNELENTYRQQFNVSVEIFKDARSFVRMRKALESREGEILVLQRGSRSAWDILFRKSRINDFIYEGSIPFITLP